MREVLDAVAEDVDSLVTQVVGALHRDLPDYQALPVSQLVPGIRTSIVSGLAAVRDRRIPSPDEMTEIAHVAQTRAQQGLSLETVLGAYRLGTRAIWAVAAERGRQAGVPTDVLLEFTGRTWEWVDRITTHAAAAHRHTEMALARYDHQQLADFVVGAVTGVLAARELQQRATAYGLDPRGSYSALRARATPPCTTYDLERQLMTVPGETLLLAVDDGDLVGIVEVGRFRGVRAGVVAIGPVGTLDALADSHRVASTVLLTASRLGLLGVNRLEQLRLVTAVACNDGLGRLCAERIVRPLEKSRVGGKDLLDTLSAFVGHGLNIQRTAQALIVHPNTVRYRLERIEHLTGVHLDSIDDLVEIWWVIQSRRMAVLPPR